MLSSVNENATPGTRWRIFLHCLIRWQPSLLVYLCPTGPIALSGGGGKGEVFLTTETLGDIFQCQWTNMMAAGLLEVHTFVWIQYLDQLKKRYLYAISLTCNFLPIESICAKILHKDFQKVLKLSLFLKFRPQLNLRFMDRGYFLPSCAKTTNLDLVLGRDVLCNDISKRSFLASLTGIDWLFAKSL